MKRYNHLLEKISDTDNLYLAYWKAKRGKEAKREVIRYGENLRQNILHLKEEIERGEVCVGNYNKFVIRDPKERVICSVPFSQRVMHHALMNVCAPIMDTFQISDSYANRIGKGTYAAIDRARAYHRKFDWCVKLDIRKYFDNIDHEVLKSQLVGLFKERLLLKIFDDIIDSYCTETARGLPIGNLTSQYCANHYLSAADHYAKETLRVKGYVRYMDDVLMFGNDRNVLMEQAKMFRSHIEAKLLLTLKVFDIRKTSQTTQFLGYRLSKFRMLLSRRSMARYKQKVREYHRMYDREMWNDIDLQSHLMPLVQFTCKADAFIYRNRVKLY